MTLTCTQRKLYIVGAVVSTVVAVASLSTSLDYRSINERIFGTKTVRVDTVFVTDTVTVSASDERILQSLNIDAIARFEGCDTNVYWPETKQSGPTIGYGLDLGNVGKARIDTLFHGLVSSRTIETLKSAHGKRGKQARAWVTRNRSLHVTKAVADSVLYRTCLMFWKQTRRTYPGIEKMDNTAQSVMLSLSINYGPTSKSLEAMRDPVRRNDIRAMIAHMRKLEAGTHCRGLVRRRQQERQLLELVASNKHTANGGDAVIFD